MADFTQLENYFIKKITKKAIQKSIVHHSFLLPVLYSVDLIFQF